MDVIPARSPTDSRVPITPISPKSWKNPHTDIFDNYFDMTLTNIIILYWNTIYHSFFLFVFILFLTNITTWSQ